MPVPVLDIVRPLDSGPATEAFLALREGSPVLLKRLKPAASGGPDEPRQGLIDKIRLVAGLEHPNLPLTLERGEENGIIPWVVSEFIPGKTLQEIGAGPLPLAIAMRVIIDAANGLHFAHRASDEEGWAFGIVHRDVRPSNVVIGRDGITRITDFGLNRMTASGNILPIPFGSPEQVAGAPVDQRSDLFSLALLLYEITTGQRPFRAARPTDLVRVMMECRPEPPSALHPAYPPELERPLLKALQRLPDERQPSCGEFADELEQALQKLGLTVDAVDVGAWLVSTFGEEVSSPAGQAGALDHTEESIPELLLDEATPSGPVTLTEELTPAPSLKRPRFLPLGTPPPPPPASLASPSPLPEIPGWSETVIDEARLAAMPPPLPAPPPSPAREAVEAAARAAMARAAAQRAAAEAATADRASLEEARAEAERARTAAAEAARERDALKGQLEESDRKLAAAQRDVEAARRAAEDTRADLALARRATEEAARAVVEARGDAAAARGTLAALSREHRAATDATQRAREEADLARANAAAAEAAAAAARREQEDTAGREADASRDTRTLALRLATSRRETEEAKEREAAARKEAAASQIATEAARTEADTARRIAAEADAGRSGAREEAERLRQELARLRERSAAETAEAAERGDEQLNAALAAEAAARLAAQGADARAAAARSQAEATQLELDTLTAASLTRVAALNEEVASLRETLDAEREQALIRESEASEREDAAQKAGTAAKHEALLAREEADRLAREAEDARRERADALRERELARHISESAAQAAEAARAEADAARREAAAATRTATDAGGELAAVRRAKEEGRQEAVSARAETEEARRETAAARAELREASNAAEAVAAALAAALRDAEAAKAESEAARKEAAAAHAEAESARAETIAAHAEVAAAQAAGAMAQAAAAVARTEKQAVEALLRATAAAPQGPVPAAPWAQPAGSAPGATSATPGSAASEASPGPAVVSAPRAPRPETLPPAAEEPDRLQHETRRHSQVELYLASCEDSPHSNFQADAGLFVGRDETLREIDLLSHADEPIVTLVGLEGSGRTRLARRYAGLRLVELSSGGGAWFADLAGVRTAEGVCVAVASALSVSLLPGTDVEANIERLGAALAARGRVLMVLDDVDGVQAALADILRAWMPVASQAKFLVVARSAMGIPGEHVCAPGPLEDAGRVFAERVRSRKRDLDLKVPGAREAIDRLAASLAGLPLAMELAASLTDRVSIASIALSLREAKGLRAVLDWIAQILAPEELDALEQLSVFAGPMAVDAACEVLDLADSPEMTAPGVVRALRSRGLLYAWEPPGLSGETRLALHPAVRTWAVARLEKSGRTAAVEARHAAAIFRSAEAYAPGNDPRALRRLLLLEPDLAAILDRDGGQAATDRAAAERCLRAVSALGTVPTGASTALGVQGLSWPLDTLIADARAAGASPALLGAVSLIHARRLLAFRNASQALVAAGAAREIAEQAGEEKTKGPAALCCALALAALGRLAEARQELEECLKSARLTADTREEVRVLGHLADLAESGANPAQAQAWREEAIEIANGAGLRSLEGELLRRHVAALQARGDPAVRPLLERALSLHREVGDRGYEQEIVARLGLDGLQTDRIDEARALYPRAIELATEQGDIRAEAALRGELGIALQLDGRLEEARGAFVRAIRLFGDVGDSANEARYVAHLGAVEAARARIPAAASSFDLARKSLAAAGQTKGLPAVEILSGFLDLARAAAGGAGAGAMRAAAAAKVASTPPDLPARLAHRLLADAVSAAAPAVQATRQ